MFSKFTTPLICLAFLGSPCLAKEKKLAGDFPRVVISDVKTTPSGELVLAVKIIASKAKDLQLNGGMAEVGAEGAQDPSGNSTPTPLPFTLNGCTLTDLRTKAVYANLPSLPAEPFFGSMQLLTTLSAGGWVQMGIAFPPLPPPTVKKEKKQPYKLQFEIPQLKISTVVTLDPVTLTPMSGAK